jgi:DNA-binding CsgD family transcriptional regulator
VQAALLAAVGTPVEETVPEERRLPEMLPDGLTRREAEILSMIARGMTNPDIANTLFVSAHTVKSHINRIFAKTGSSDRAGAVRYAVEHHLV